MGIENADALHVLGIIQNTARRYGSVAKNDTAEYMKGFTQVGV